MLLSYVSHNVTIELLKTKDPVIVHILSIIMSDAGIYSRIN